MHNTINTLKNQKQLYTNYNAVKKCLFGFIFSIILTIIPFAMVIYSNLSKNKLITIISVCAIIQIIIHLIYFLHINISYEQRWNLISLLFTLIIVSILIVGSLWIMWHLHSNLMNCH